MTLGAVNLNMDFKDPGSYYRGSKSHPISNLLNRAISRIPFSFRVFQNSDFSSSGMFPLTVPNLLTFEGREWGFLWAVSESASLCIVFSFFSLDFEDTI